MLFLIGTNDSNIKNGRIENETCPNCKSKDTLYFSIFSKYVYITMIPLFPVGKHLNIQCENCKNWFDYEDLSADGQEKLKKLNLKNPIWMFLGSALIILFAAYSVSNYNHNQNENDILIKTPNVGDVYNLKLSNGYYSTMKISSVTKDSIYTIHNDFNAYLPYEIDDIDKDENYSNRTFSYSKKELLQLYKNEEIIKVRRSKYPN